MTTITGSSLIHLDDFRADPRFADIKGQGYATVIIDTGIDLDHPIFGADTDSNGIADRIVYQYDFADNDADASDKNNHGSHLASIVATIAPDTNLIILKIFTDSGYGGFPDLETALQWVNKNAETYKIAAVNVSLGDSQNWTTTTTKYGLEDEFAAIADRGIIVSIAAGNSFSTFNSNPGLLYPAIDPSVISVGTIWTEDVGKRVFGNGSIDYTTAPDRIASFSQRSPLLDVFAPGALIAGANATGGITTMSGTSQSSAYIAAIATLSQQIAGSYLGRKLTFAEFRTLIHSTSDPIIDGDDEDDNVTNTGVSYPRVNVLALATGILKLIPNSSPVVDTINQTIDRSLNLPDTSLESAPTVTLADEKVAVEIDFGNQKINEVPDLPLPTIISVPITTPVLDILPIEDSVQKSLLEPPQIIQEVGMKNEIIVVKDNDRSTPNLTDLVLKVEAIDKFKAPVGTSLQGHSEGEVIDLRGFAGQNLKVDTVCVGDAAYQNYIGFYAVEDAQGTLANGLKVGDAGYAEAAIKSAILRSFKHEIQLNLAVTGGKIFAPVVIANGTFEDYLNRNPQNQANSNIHAYFNYLGANTDKVDHFRLLGDNKFGVEDMYGGGDRDYNDIICQVTVNG